MNTSDCPFVGWTPQLDTDYSSGFCCPIFVCTLDTIARLEISLAFRKELCLQVQECILKNCSLENEYSIGIFNNINDNYYY